MLVMGVFVLFIVLGAMPISVISANATRRVSRSNFTFSEKQALVFFESLVTPSGLLRIFPNSTTIYLADDQQLDYSALRKIGNTLALSLADKIDSAMNYVGGLYGGFSSPSCTFGYWNGTDVVLDKYMPIPCGATNWNLISGNDAIFANSSMIPGSAGYSINVTFWNGNVGSGYVRYTDLDLYYSLNELHYGNYSQALAAFENANKYWNGKGFADAPYNSSYGYASYKLALDLIVFKALSANNNTIRQVSNFTTRMTVIKSYMSTLQMANGGVVTNYEIGGNKVTAFPGALENGETTSLFVLAY